MQRVFVTACGLAAGLVAALPLASPAMARTGAEAGAQAEPGPLAPRDECARLPGYAEFRERLGRAITLRDADALIALTDENVTLDFGGGSGVAELRERLANGAFNSWAELADAVRLGCGIGGASDADKGADQGEGADASSQEPDSIAFPWYFPKSIGGYPFETVIVTGVDVPLRAARSDDGAILRRISWDWVLVRFDENHDSDDVQPGYWAVTTQDGVPGFIGSHALRSMIDFRVLANRIDGEWKITAFVAGEAG